MAISCYFDDSHEGGIFVVAGYMNTVESWDKEFAPGWFEILRDQSHSLSEFKASDCRQRTGEFANWTRAECNALTERLVSFIADGQRWINLIGLGEAVVVPIIPDRVSQPKWESFAYLMCAGLLMYDVGKVYSRLGAEDSIHLIFDRQRGQEGKAHEIFREAEGLLKERGLLSCKISPPQFLDSESLAPLQAADLLAYETFKEAKNRLIEDWRGPSMALQRLIKGKPHVAHIIDVKLLQEIRKAVELGQAVDFDVDVPWLYRSWYGKPGESKT